MRIRARLSLIACAALTACGAVNYKDAPEGEFSGSVLVMWVGENNSGSGDGRFVFVPSPTQPLTFTRKNPDATVHRITPEMMYTDGGSIPRPAQLFNGFSPWGYAPAYMVHDWIFVARHCLTDGTPRAAERVIAPMPFHESAEVIAEAIKTLIAENRVQRNDVAPQVISGAVAGPISFRRWVVKGACAGDRVSDKHRREAEAALARRTGRGILRSDVTPARIVTEISF